MFALALITHGGLGHDGHFFVEFQDGNIPLEALMKPIYECKDLKGRPKIFFIQVRF